MPTYTMRLCRLGKDRPNDFQLLVDGKAAGRCYLTKAADNRDVWRWTRPMESVSVLGLRNEIKNERPGFRRP